MPSDALTEQAVTIRERVLQEQADGRSGEWRADCERLLDILVEEGEPMTRRDLQMIAHRSNEELRNRLNYLLELGLIETTDGPDWRKTYYQPVTAGDRDV